MTALTRGPLPARTYWTRRVVVIVLLVGLVIGSVQVVRLLAAGSPPEPDRAAPMAAEPSGGTTPAEGSQETRAAAPVQKKEKRKQRNKKGKDKGPVLAEPSGPCDDRDVAVTPTVDRAVGGGPITFVIELRSVDADACTWRVSPQSLTVKITSGKDDIWSTLQCQRAIPRRNVVVRRAVSTEVEVTWSARRSDEGCNTGQGDWAMPGWYFVKAAALAGEPSDLHFEVTQPEPEVITETVGPKRDKQDKKGNRDNRADRDAGSRSGN